MNTFLIYCSIQLFDIGIWELSAIGELHSFSKNGDSTGHPLVFPFNLSL
ncbi:hypothetical protein V2H45_16770 [Tumidithrix elongata RA019]|uniref:Uncharacterized protein n=1 Tax=Tumidithrix elongata BACA0141 TaxID=2716417 RepID=A0AAW9Q651_9CYAN|nr:hypothetical protein [Tumidithrix elongata RA019]